MKFLPYADDCKRLQSVLLDRFQIAATLSEVHDYWSWHSQRYAASWLGLPLSDEDLREEVRQTFPTYAEDQGLNLSDTHNPFHLF